MIYTLHQIFIWVVKPRKKISVNVAPIGEKIILRKREEKTTWKT